MMIIKENLYSLFVTACCEGDMKIILLLLSFYKTNPEYLYYYDMLLENGISRAICKNHIHILYFFNIMYKKDIHYNEIIRTAIIITDKRHCHKKILNYITNKYGFSYNRKWVL